VHPKSKQSFKKTTVTGGRVIIIFEFIKVLIADLIALLPSECPNLKAKVMSIVLTKAVSEPTNR
jgi:hypothetical protein